MGYAVTSKVIRVHPRGMLIPGPIVQRHQFRNRRQLVEPPVETPVSTIPAPRFENDRLADSPRW